MADPGARPRATRTGRVVEEVAAPTQDAAPPQDAAQAGADALVCNVAFCPICVAVTTARTVAPDAVDHLLAAAREFFLAARAIVDLRADDLEGNARSEPTHLEKIEIG